MCSQQPRAASIFLHRKIPKLSGFKTNSCPSACALMWSPLHAFFPLPLLQLPEPNPWQRLRGQTFWKIAAASMVPSGCQSLSKIPAEECEGLPLPRLAPTLLSWKGLGGTLRLQQLKAEPQEVASTPCPRGRLSAPCSVALRLTLGETNGPLNVSKTCRLWLWRRTTSNAPLLFRKLLPEHTFLAHRLLLAHKRQV